MRLHGEAGEWWLAAPHFSCSCWASLPPGCQSRQPLLSMHLPPGTPCFMHIPCGSTQRMRYGFLTCYRYTYFLQFVGPKQYAITGAFLATATNPSVAAILYCECPVPGRSTTAAGGVPSQTPAWFHFIWLHSIWLVVTFQQSSMPIVPLVEVGSCVSCNACCCLPADLCEKSRQEGLVEDQGPSAAMVTAPAAGRVAAAGRGAARPAKMARTTTAGSRQGRGAQSEKQRSADAPAGATCSSTPGVIPDGALTLEGRLGQGLCGIVFLARCASSVPETALQRVCCTEQWAREELGLEATCTPIPV